MIGELCIKKLAKDILLTRRETLELGVSESGAGCVNRAGVRFLHIIRAFTGTLIIWGEKDGVECLGACDRSPWVTCISRLSALESITTKFVQYSSITPAITLHLTLSLIFVFRITRRGRSCLLLKLVRPASVRNTPAVG